MDDADIHREVGRTARARVGADVLSEVGRATRTSGAADVFSEVSATPSGVVRHLFKCGGGLFPLILPSPQSTTQVIVIICSCDLGHTFK